MKAHQSKTLAAFTSLAVAFSVVVPSTSALTVPEAITSIQSSNPTLPTGVVNPKGNIGFLLANMFWKSSDFGYDSSKFWKLKPEYVDGIGTWTQTLTGAYLTSSSSNVWIGTTSPAASLEVKRSVADGNFAAWIEGLDVSNYWLWVNVANTTSSKAVADFRSANASRLFVRADGNVGIGTNTPSSSAALDVYSTTKGFLPPRVTQAQRDVIASPVAGLTVYNSDTKQLNIYDGSAWWVVAGGGGGDIVPVGSVVPYSSATVPTGYLECNGTAVSRTTYSELFAIVGTTYGAGDGSTTFTLPDLRGEFIRGWDHARGVDSGRGLGSVQADAFQGHWHEKWATVFNQLSQGGSWLAAEAPTTAIGNNTQWSSDVVRSPTTDGTNGAPRTAGETRPRNVALMYLIKVKTVSSVGPSGWTAVGSNLTFSSGSIGIGTATPGASLEVKRSDADSGFAAWIEGLNIANYGLGVNIAATDASRAIADFKSGNTSKFFIRSDGNVGIWTVSPGYKLDVAGTANVTGFRMSTGAGAGKVLTSDASGLATWETAATGGGITAVTTVSCQHSDYFGCTATCPATYYRTACASGGVPYAWFTPSWTTSCVFTPSSTSGIWYGYAFCAK